MRVIAGALRGRKLHSVKGPSIRPTSDRARESLFACLGPSIAETHWLDLFAGTGAVGIEAISRGAANVVFVERARAATQVLERNLTDLGLVSQTRVLRRDVRAALQGLAREGCRFDWVFADPPYASDWLPVLVESPEMQELLGSTGVLVIERAAAEPPSSKLLGLRRTETRTFGGTAFDWFEKESTHV